MWRLNKLASTCFKNSIDDDILFCCCYCDSWCIFTCSSLAFIHKYWFRERSAIVKLISHWKSMDDKSEWKVSRRWVESASPCVLHFQLSGDLSMVPTGYSSSTYSSLSKHLWLLSITSHLNINRHTWPFTRIKFACSSRLLFTWSFPDEIGFSSLLSAYFPPATTIATCQSKFGYSHQ